MRTNAISNPLNKEAVSPYLSGISLMLRKDLVGIARITFQSALTQVPPRGMSEILSWEDLTASCTLRSPHE